MKMLQELKKELSRIASPAKAAALSRYFKTGKGQYGEGDAFIGITVPALRSVAKRFADLPLPALEKLLKSKIHEHRLAALEILVFQYEKAAKEKDLPAQKKIFDFYLAHPKGINNWDLVDASAPYIVGEYLAEEHLPIQKKVALLARLGTSESVWERRIAIVSTAAFIRRGYLIDTFHLCELLMKDKHDLIHKACGWMLREAGKRDRKALERFLRAHAAKMPRTMLRYSLERFSPADRKIHMSAK